MKKLLRVPALVAVAVACAALPALAAPVAATIKREDPLWYTGVYLRGTPVSSPVVGMESIAYDGLQVWVANRSNGTVQRYDALNNTLKGTVTIPAPGQPRKLVFDGTYMWVFTIGDTKAYKYSTAGALQSGFPLNIGYETEGAAFDGEFIWASTGYAGGGLTRINANTRAFTHFGNIGNQGAVAFDGKDLWITRSGTTRVSAGLAPGSTAGAVLATGLAGGGDGTSTIASDGEYIWVASAAVDSTLYKIDPRTNATIDTKTTYPGVHSLAFDGALLWVVCHESDTIMKIDPRTDAVVGTIQLPAGSFPAHIVFDGAFMWVSAAGSTSPPVQPSQIFKFVARR